MGQLHQIIPNPDHGKQPEHTQQQLTVFVPQLHPERHTRVEYIMEFQPVANEFDLTRKARRHVEMHSQFHALIDRDQQEGQQKVRDRVFLNHKKFGPTNWSGRLYRNTPSGVPVGCEPPVWH